MDNRIIIKKDFYKNAVKNFLILLSVPFSQIVRNLIIVFFISKYMKIKDVGVWGQVIAIHSFMYIFLNLNLTHSITRFFPAIREDTPRTSSYFWAVNVIMLLTTGMTLFLFSLFPSFFSKIFFNSVKYSWLVPLVGIFIFLEVYFNNIFSYFRAIQQHSWQAIIVLVRSFLELGIIGGGIYLLHKAQALELRALFVLYFVSLGISTMIGYVSALIKGYLVLTKPDFSVLKEYLSFGLPQLPASLSHWILNLSDRFIINYFLGLEALGIYFLANRIAMVLTVPLGPFNSVIFTEFSRRKDYGIDVQKYKKLSLTLYSIGLVIFAVSLYCSLPYLIALLGLEKFDGDKIIKIMPFFFMSIFLFSAFSVCNLFLGVEKKSLKIGLLWIIVAVINLVLNFVFVPYLGIMGAVVSSSIAYLVGITVGMLK